MDDKLVYVDILKELHKIYSNKIDASIEQVRLIQHDLVALEIYKTLISPNGRKICMIIKNDLSIIIENPDICNEPMFSTDNDIENNVDKLLSLDEVTLLNVTDLFNA